MIAVPLLACSVVLDTVFCVLPLFPALQVRTINNSYVSMSQKFRIRISYGHTMCPGRKVLF